MHALIVPRLIELLPCTDVLNDCKVQILIWLATYFNSNSTTRTHYSFFPIEHTIDALAHIARDDNPALWYDLTAIARSYHNGNTVPGLVYRHVQTAAPVLLSLLSDELVDNEGTNSNHTHPTIAAQALF